MALKYEQPSSRKNSNRVLVTGAYGFLGKRVIKGLRNTVKTAKAYDDDVRELHARKKQYNVVCHLAGLTKLSSQKNLKEFYDINVYGTLSVLEYCRKSNAHCVFASSSAVYLPSTGKTRRLRETSALNPQNIYGITKLIAEEFCHFYSRQYSVSVTVLRIFNMYGQGQAATFLIPYILQQLKRRKHVILKTPKAVRDYVHVADVADAVIQACYLERKGFVVLNVGTGFGISVESLVRKIASFVNTSPKIQRTLSHISVNDSVVADINNTIRLLGWKPQVCLEKGLQQMLLDG